MWLVIIIDVPFVASLVLAVIAQIMMRALYYPTGIGMLESFENEKKEMSFMDYEVYRLKCMHKYTESMFKANNTRAKIVKWSYIVYLVGLITLLGKGIITLL